MQKKIQPYGTCTSGANSVWSHEMRAQNGATISPGAYNTTITPGAYTQVPITRTAAACTQYPYTLRHLHLSLSSALFCICTRTTRTLSHPLPAKHGLLTERFSKPNVRFASATHARALHAHNKPWLLWKTRKGQWARTFHAVTKSAGS